MPPVCRSCVVSCVFLIAAGTALGQGSGKAPSHPILPGFERFYAGPGGDPVMGGRLLLGELNCTSCHAADAARDAVIPKRTAPLLDGVGSRIKTLYLRKSLTDPQAIKPG